MSKFNYAKLKYVVGGREGFDMNTAFRLWKTKYDDFKDFQREVTNHPALKDLENYVHEIWNEILPFTVQDAFKVSNLEERRIYFDCIGVNKLFAQLQPELKDKKTIKKKRQRWDDKNDKYEYEFEDIYELYELDGTKLYGVDRWGQAPNNIFAVRCWCTTTNREYWLYVSPEAATGDAWYRPGRNAKWDAIRAIAWTIRIDITNPERIYRQGDIVVAKMSKTSETVRPYHLTADQYLKLMYSET